MESVAQNLLNTIKSFALLFPSERFFTAKFNKKKKSRNHSNTSCEIIPSSNVTKHEAVTITLGSILPVCTSEVDSSQKPALCHPLSGRELSPGGTAPSSAPGGRLNWLQFWARVRIEELLTYAL